MAGDPAASRKSFAAAFTNNAAGVARGPRIPGPRIVVGGEDAVHSGAEDAFSVSRLRSRE